MNIKKIVSVIVAFSVFSAVAYADVYPEKELTLCEAMGIEDIDSVYSGYMVNVNESLAVKLTDNQIEDFILAGQNITLKRQVVKNPFSGVAIVLETVEGDKTYFPESGVQIGKYGDDNYLCYTTDVQDDTIDSLYASYKGAEDKYFCSTFVINDEMDYLIYPSEQWAVSEVLFSASNSLIPYEVTEHFGEAVSREMFCVLVANLLSVCWNYVNLDDYFRDKDMAYLKNYFVDTEGCDKSISTLNSLGIVSGKSDDLFCPDDALTRQESAVMLMKTAKLLGIPASDEKVVFDDFSDVASWAVDSVEFVGGNKIMNGSDNKFSPSGFLTTEQAIVGINRLFKLYRNKI